MWRVPTRKQTPATPVSPASQAASAAQYTIQSVGRPQTTLGVCSQRGRGFTFTLTDSLARGVTTPTIPNESIVRALEGSPVVFRNGGFTVEMTPVDDLIRIRCISPSGQPIEGTFQSDDIERSMKSTPAPLRRNLAFGQ